jgi:hypothetical protein
MNGKIKINDSVSVFYHFKTVLAFHGTVASVAQVLRSPEGG